jgi:hypothetical protein
MSNAIANVSSALSYDAIESALVMGSLADACKVAAAAFEAAPLGATVAEAVSGYSSAMTSATVRPASKSR